MTNLDPSKRLTCRRANTAKQVTSRRLGIFNHCRGSGLVQVDFEVFDEERLLERQNGGIEQGSDENIALDLPVTSDLEEPLPFKNSAPSTFEIHAHKSDANTIGSDRLEWKSTHSSNADDSPDDLQLELLQMEASSSRYTSLYNRLCAHFLVPYF